MMSLKVVFQSLFEERTFAELSRGNYTLAYDHLERPTHQHSELTSYPDIMLPRETGFNGLDNQVHRRLEPLGGYGATKNVSKTRNEYA